MPAGLVLHEADALTLHRIRQNDNRSSSDRLGLLQSVHDLLHIVAIDAQHIPAETGVFRRQRLDLHHVFDQAINLQAIAVDDANQIVELVVSSLHRGLPNLALLLFAVAHDAENLVLLLVESSGQRKTHRDAQPLAQRSGGHFHARQLQPVGMALIRRTQFAQSAHIVDGTESGKGETEI